MIVPDLRGFGESDKHEREPAEQYEAVAQARGAVPTTVLWPEHDPLFPRAWGDRIDEFFAAADLRPLAGAGHFSPLEAPEAWAAAIRERLLPLA